MLRDPGADAPSRARALVSAGCKSSRHSSGIVLYNRPIIIKSINCSGILDGAEPADSSKRLQLQPLRPHTTLFPAHRLIATMAPKAEKQPAKKFVSKVGGAKSGGRKKGSKKAIESYKIYIYKVNSLDSHTYRLSMVDRRFCKCKWH